MIGRVFLALALSAFATAATAVPNAGGTSPRYCGSVWFTKNSGVGVCGGTYAQWVASLQSTIQVRLGWGWVVSSMTPCTLSQWLAPPYLRMGGGDPVMTDSRGRPNPDPGNRG